jgi:lysyl-tRNA synthetase class 2
MSQGIGSHTHHISTHIHILSARYEILRAIREFFWSENFCEIESPLIVAHPGQEPNIDVVPVAVHNHRGEAFHGFLHTSPEYTMKKMLASGFEKIFYLGKVFRDRESMEHTHHPEFTMVEWYRVEATLNDIMNDVEQVCRAAATRVIERCPEFETIARRFVTEKWKRMTMRELWMETVSIDLEQIQNREDFVRIARERGYEVSDMEQYEEIFYRIFLAEIEPRLAHMGFVMIYHYPRAMASLSRLTPDKKYGMRVEAYIDGIELTNGFEELTDADEQRARFLEEQVERKKYGKPVHALDEEFIDSLRRMPPSAGISLGIDRLVMVMTGCKNIEDVLVLPMKLLF